MVQQAAAVQHTLKCKCSVKAVAIARFVPSGNERVVNQCLPVPSCQGWKGLVVKLEWQLLLPRVCSA